MPRLYRLRWPSQRPPLRSVCRRSPQASSRSRRRRIQQGTDTIAVYRSLRDVAYVEPNRRVQVSATPNDTYVGDQYALSRIRARRGWSEYGRLWRRQGGAAIAIIDSGIDVFHPELGGKLFDCRSFMTGTGLAAPGCQDSQFHGTHVAGIAAGIANNRTGIAGVAFDAPIMVLQAINSSGYGFTADVAAAMVYAAKNRAKVASYSFSSPESSRAERDAVAYAASRGVVQVGATGNSGARGVQYPAGLSQVIAVGATNRRHKRAAFSTYGPQVEVVAPGKGILSTLPGAAVYGELSGTSMAAPHVAGLAALLRAKGYGAPRTRRLIRRGANDLGSAGRDAKYGYGRINVARTLP
ncbi:MAG: S8 family serine peptidase [Nitriliruptorales bacterium]|nr:S8 family serine peptidase [Nitriliruptorales bacterium]